MPKKRISEAEAFAFYCASGANRSYSATAKHFGCSRNQIQRMGSANNWVRRVEEHEQRAAAKVESELEETMAEMHARHLNAVRACFAKSMEAMEDVDLAGFADVVKGLEFAIKSERLIREQPTDRTSIDFERRPVLRLPDVPAGLDPGRWRALFDGDADDRADQN